MKKLVIFDLDGTLLNTIDDLGTACNHALECNGFPIHDISSYPFMVGNGVRRLIERALPEGARNHDTVERLLVDFKRFYDEHDHDLTFPYPGITELLTLLTQRGIKVAVASNKYLAAVERLIRHYFPDIAFAAIEGQRDGVPVKPDPSVIFEVLATSPTPKADVLYVGDSGVDMETARRACVGSVGVTWGFRPVSELRAAYADIIVNSPEEILDLCN